MTGKLGAAVQLAAGGTLRGTGTVGGDIGPGGDNTQRRHLAGRRGRRASACSRFLAGRVMPMNGGSYTVDMTDALGAAGIGHDCLDVGGDLWLGYVGSGGHMNVRLRSGVGGASNFNRALQYTWDIMHVTGEVTLFDPSAFVVDITGFHNETQGIFRVQKVDGESGGATIQLVYTPIDTHTWDGGAGWDKPDWSNPLNWVGDSLPSNGDDLVFPDSMPSSANNDDFLTSVGSVDLGMGAGAYGSAVTVGGLLFGRAYELWGSSWGCPTTLRDDTTISTSPSDNPTGAPFSIGEVSLEDGFGVGHTLTVDSVDWNRVSMEGGLTGKGALVKKGTGVLLLGGYWPGSGYTWDGPTDVQAGTLWIVTPGALSSHTDVHIAADATVKATIWGLMEPDRDTWGSTFTGDGTLDVSDGYLTLTAASDSFTGVAQCGSGASLTQNGSFPARTEVMGTLRGTGTVGPLTVGLLDPSHGRYDAGSVSPGAGDFESGTLTVGGAGSIGGGSSYACDVSDAEGAPGTGYDQLAVDGDVTFAGSAESPVAVVLRSGAGGGEGPAAGFRRSGSYRWSVLRAGGSIAGFTEAAVTLDASAFVRQNPNATGTFSLEVADDGAYRTLDVVYAPPAVATLGWTGGGLSGNWSDPGNWDLARAPQDGDSLVFTGDANVDTVNDLAGLTLADVEFSSMSVFSVSGDPVTLTGGVSLPDDRATVDWNADIVLSAGAHLFSTLSQELRVAGDISGGAGAQATLLTGAQGAVRLSGANTFAGDVLVAGKLDVRSADALPGTAAVTVQGAGTLSFTNDSPDVWTVANAFSGPEGARIEVQSGAVTLTGDSSRVPRADVDAIDHASSHGGRWSGPERRGPGPRRHRRDRYARRTGRERHPVDDAPVLLHHDALLREPRRRRVRGRDADGRRHGDHRWRRHARRGRLRLRRGPAERPAVGERRPRDGGSGRQPGGSRHRRPALVGRREGGRRRELRPDPAVPVGHRDGVRRGDDRRAPGVLHDRRLAVQRRLGDRHVHRRAPGGRQQPVRRVHPGARAQLDRRGRRRGVV